MIEWSAALLSLMSVWLMARRSVTGWPVALLACLMYGWVFFHARLYADMVLQGAFCIGIMYGWYLWTRDRTTKASTTDLTPRLPAQPLVLHTALEQGGIALLGSCLWGYALLRWSQDPAPLMDAGLSGASLLAQYWTARRHRESWLLWAGIDLLYIILFMERGLAPTALLYAAFVGIALYGYRAWQSHTNHMP